LGGQKWGTSAISEAGFVRVSSNRSAIPTAVSPPEAIELLKRMRKLKGHMFLSDDVPLVTGDYLAPRNLSTYRQVTDAHLLALALRHGGKLATFDRGVQVLAEEKKSVVLVPTR
jgi:predicted nucleic acid-binding protein